MQGSTSSVGRRRNPAPGFRVPSLAACLVTLVAVSLGGPRMRAAERSDAPADHASAASIEALESKLKRVRESKEIDEADRAELIDSYSESIERLRAAAELAGKARAWEKTAEAAPAELEKARAELDRLSDKSDAARLPADAPSGLAAMQQALARAEADRDHRRQELSDLNDESDRRSERRREISERNEEIEHELEEIDEALGREPEEGETDDKTLARQTLLHARRKALVQEQETHRLELLAFEATAELVAALRDLAATRMQTAEDLVEAWQQAVNDLRKSEAERELDEARRRLDRVHPALRAAAQANVQLAEARRDIALRIEQTTAESETASDQLDELREQFERISERARKIGFNEAIGVLLRKHRDTLPDIHEITRKKRARDAEVSRLNVRLTDYEEEREKLADLHSRVRSEMTRLRAAIPAAESVAAERELTDLLETQRHSLDALIRDTTRYVDELIELEGAERQLVACVREFAEFSDEHILWIRSSGYPQPADAGRLAAAAAWIVRQSGWQNAARSLAADAAAHASIYTTAAVFLIGLVLCRRRIAPRLEMTPPDDPATHANSSAMAADLALAALDAFWLPAIVGFIGVRLAWSAQADEFVRALGRGLTNLALPCFILDYGRRLLLRGRIAETCFGCHDALRALARGTATRLLLFGMPLLLLVLITEAQSSELFRSTLGRLAFVTLLALCSWSAYRLWRGVGGSMTTGLQSPADSGWRPRARALARMISIAAPLGLAAASLAGYHYTALQLAQRSGATVAFTLSVIAVARLGSRRLRDWNSGLVGVDHSADHFTGTDSSLASETAERVAADQTSDSATLPFLAAQMQHLVRFAGILALLCGTAWIWSGIVPVMRLLCSVELWPRPFRWVDPAVLADESAKIVTLAELGTAILVVAVTLAAVRNVHGVLELTLFRRVPLDAGARYAAAAVCRYLIGLAGLIGACAQLGVSWSQLNWLVAAMTVGLGFGLQEIFANFVSGLILLFERPVRIGDIVSVEGVTGTVSRIRIRATTITDGDMRELIVPNKELITGRVINWTLSNTVARMTIVVRTAHGVDPDKARNLLLTVAAQHPLVLKQPPPQALFDEFSDKALNFTLRVYMASCDVYPQLRHELLTAIQRTFRQSGIALSSSDATTLPVPVPTPEPRAA